MEDEYSQKLSLNLKVSTKEQAENPILMWEEVRTTGRHPARRSYHSAVMWGDKMIVIGGQDLSEGPQGGVWGIEIGQFGQDNWELLQVEDIGKFSRHSSILKNSKMYVFGGTTGTEEFNRTMILDLLTLTWKELLPDTEIPPALDSHTACLYESKENDYMVVFGGYSRGNRTNEVYMLDLRTLKWKYPKIEGPKPEVRSGHSAVVHKDFMYVFGGVSDEGEKLNDFWRLDLKALTWQQVLGQGEIPTGRSGHSAIVYRDLMVMFGGMKDITKETNDMYSYNFKENYWILFQYEQPIKDPVSPDQLEEYKKTKASMAAAIKMRNNNNFEPSPIRASPTRRPTLTDGSRNSPARRDTNPGDSSPSYRRRRTLYEGPLNPTEGRIRGRLPHPRDGHTAVVNGDIMIIFGGDRHQMPFNDTYVYYLVEENIKTPVSSY